jgi:hypothetical protein
MRELIHDVTRIKDSPLIPPALLPYLYTLVGDKDHAIAGLEENYRVHGVCMLFLNVNPDWDGLRSDPRFQDLVRRVGLPR